jgi:hypothetical protein
VMGLLDRLELNAAELGGRGEPRMVLLGIVGRCKRVRIFVAVLFGKCAVTADGRLSGVDGVNLPPLAIPTVSACWHRLTPLSTTSLRDVLPRTMGNDPFNGAYRSAKTFSDLLDGDSPVKRPNLTNDVVIQNRVSIPCADCMTTLGNHVKRVVLSCSRKDVLRVAARRVVAGMATEQIAKRNVVGEVVGQTMCLVGYPAELDVAVTRFNCASLERPTRIRTAAFIHKRPESIGEIARSVKVMALRRTEPSTATQQLRRLGVKLSSAMTTLGIGGKLLAHRWLLSAMPTPRLLTQCGGFSLPAIIPQMRCRYVV